MAKITIYVPDELKVRMDAEDGVNWSAKAQAAFETELAIRLKNHPKDRTMKTAIQRLKASKAANERALITAGRTSGARWAKEKAEWPQLDRIAKFWTEAEAEWNHVIDHGEGWALGVYAAIVGQDDAEWSNAEEFWEACLLEARPEGDHLAGFILGALEVFDAVEEA